MASHYETDINHNLRFTKTKTTVLSQDMLLLRACVGSLATVITQCPPPHPRDPGPDIKTQSQCPLISAPWPGTGGSGAVVTNIVTNTVTHQPAVTKKTYRLTSQTALQAPWLSLFVSFRASSILAAHCWWQGSDALGVGGTVVAVISFLWCKFYDENVNFCSLLLAVCGTLYDTGRCQCCYHDTKYS